MRDPFIGQRLTARHFAELMWSEEVEPFGEKREDYRTAQVVQMLHNMNVAPNDRKPVEEFLLSFAPAVEQKQSVDEQIMVLNILAAALGAG